MDKYPKNKDDVNSCLPTKGDYQTTMVNNNDNTSATEVSTNTSPNISKKKKKKAKRCTLDGCNEKLHLMRFTCEYCKKDFCLTHNRNHNCLYEEKALREEKLRLTTKLENETCIAIKVDKI